MYDQKKHIQFKNFTFQRCLSDENINIKSLENLFHEKAVDHTAVYAKANQFGAELFQEYTVEERKQKLDNEVCLFIISNFYFFISIRFLDYNKILIYKVEFEMK